MAYQHIFFDLDHTLWDFERNATETLIELYGSYQLDKFSTPISLDLFLKTFSETNAELWNLYNHSKIDQATLRNTRFKTVFKKLGIPESQVPHLEISNQYIFQTPHKPHLIPHTLEVLDYLKEKYILHIVSNGFAEVQAIKLEKSGIRKYFKEVVTPDDAGFKKPSREIFDFTIARVQTEAKDCIMIGDNLEADIKGAINAGLDHVFFNPEQQKHQEKLTYEIDSLLKLTDFL